MSGCDDDVKGGRLHRLPDTTEGQTMTPDPTREELREIADALRLVATRPPYAWRIGGSDRIDFDRLADHAWHAVVDVIEARAIPTTDETLTYPDQWTSVD